MPRSMYFAFIIVFFGIILCTFLTSNKGEDVAQRGCCSHHSGVCGCQYGRIVCCDGSYSPTCTCHHDDIMPVPNM